MEDTKTVGLRQMGWASVGSTRGEVAQLDRDSEGDYPSKSIAIDKNSVDLEFLMSR